MQTLLPHYSPTSTFAAGPLPGWRLLAAPKHLLNRDPEAVCGQCPAQQTWRQPRGVTRRTGESRGSLYIGLERNTLLSNVIFKNWQVLCNILKIASSLHESLQSKTWVCSCIPTLCITQGHQQTWLPLNSKMYIGGLEITISWAYHQLCSHLSLTCCSILIGKDEIKCIVFFNI